MVKLVNLLEVRLMENKRTYEAMLKPLFDFVDIVVRGLDLPEDESIQVKTRVNELVSNMRKSLRRSDNIIWAIQHIRYEEFLRIMDEMVNNFFRIPRSSPVTDEQQYVLDYALKLKKSFAKSLLKATNAKDAEREVRYFSQSSLEHYGSYMNPTEGNFIPEMAEVSFTGRTYLNVERVLNDIENKWKERQTRVINYDNDPKSENYEVLIRFPDGSQWVNLHVASCDLEGQAMGHCGNSYRRDPRYEVLSYRTPSNKHGVPTENTDTRHWVPHLTFIYDKDTGNIVEAKGRANNKPNHKYDRVVIELFKLPFIRGISYSGYMPENNFNLKEVDDDLKKELVSKKPDFASMAYWSWEIKDTHEAFSALLDEFKQYDVPMPEEPYLINGNYVEVYSEDVRYFNSSSVILRDLIALYTGDDIDDFMFDNANVHDSLLENVEVPQDTIWNAIYDFDDDALEKIADYFHVSTRQNRISMIDDLVFKIQRHDEIFLDLLGDISITKKVPFTNEDVASVINLVLSYGPEPDYIIHLDPDTDKISFTITLDTLIAGMESIVSDDPYEGILVYYAKQYGNWETSISENILYNGDYFDESVTDNIHRIMNDADNDFDRLAFRLIENGWDKNEDAALAEFFEVDVSNIDVRDVKDAILEYFSLNESLNEFEHVLLSIMEQSL